MFLPINTTEKEVATNAKEIREITKLFHALQEIDNRPNILTLQEFSKFEPLFKKNQGLSSLKILELSKQFTSVLDLYKPTVIIQDNVNRVVLFELPPVFIPLRSLPLTKETEEIVAANQALFHSNVPKYSNDAFGRMVSAIMNEQDNNKDIVTEYKQQFVESVKQFYEKFPNAIPLVEKTTKTEITNTSSDTEWD